MPATDQLIQLIPSSLGDGSWVIPNNGTVLVWWAPVSEAWRAYDRENFCLHEERFETAEEAARFVGATTEQGAASCAT